MRADDINMLPAGLPAPADDGACEHLRGASIPPIALPATNGEAVRLDDPAAPTTVVFAYPRTGRPGEEPPGGLDAWNLIPGARGCTPQACAYRDRHAEFVALGARVFGLSTQDTPYQLEAVERLALPYPLLSDHNLVFADALGLPRFQHFGLTLLRRHTLIIEAGRIVEVFYPVFPSDADADHAINWLRAKTSKSTTGRR
jgi:peroxiredoxin